MKPEYYELRILETLNEDRREWFEDLEIRKGPGQTTVLAGYFADQAQLHGVLLKILNLNLTLLEISNHPERNGSGRPQPD